MKNKVINAAICDTRYVTEESLAGFENITINAAVLIAGERSKELLNRYHVTMNVANMVNIQDEQDISVKSISGKCDIGPNANGTDVFLMVNGQLTIANDSLEAVKSYYGIMVNGQILMPKSYQGQLQNITGNGKTEYYPDGATILKADTKIDNLFISRALNPLYYCWGNLFFLDTEIDIEMLITKGIRFGAKRIIIAESLLAKIVSLLDEEAEIIRVPDGTRLIDDDLELKSRTIKKYGTKLCVCGDVSIQDAEALSFMEYLFTDGTVSVNKNLEEAFDEIESIYNNLEIVDPDAGYISERPAIKVGVSMLKKYPNGVRIEDCAKVTLSENLSQDDIMEKLHISNCALVICTKEQEEAVNMVAEDIAMIRVFVQNQDKDDDEMIGSIFGQMKDAQVINAAEYKM